MYRTYSYKCWIKLNLENFWNIIIFFLYYKVISFHHTCLPCLSTELQVSGVRRPQLPPYPTWSSDYSECAVKCSWQLGWTKRCLSYSWPLRSSEAMCRCPKETDIEYDCLGSFLLCHSQPSMHCMLMHFWHLWGKNIFRVCTILAM